MTSDSDIRNAEQIAAWNDKAGHTWVKMNAGLDRQLQPIGDRMLAHADLAAGLSVLDIGCGAGATSIQAARAVGPRGTVLGVDVSAPLLELARERSADLANLSFMEADAQVAPFEPGSFDRVVSRFGVMFFDDPAAAFANIRAGCRPGALMSFACWREGRANPWLTMPMQAASHLVDPLPPAEPGAPGPTAFADPERVRSILGGAGWRVVSIEPLDVDVGGGDLEATTTLMTRVGPVGHAIRNAGAGRELITAVEDAVREVLRGFIGPDGLAAMPSASWIVTARA
jgi:SAM-dependent methyltransferase